jgi:hypothetical protein
MDTNKQYTWWLKALSGADVVQARRFADAIALEIGWGGISKVEELTGISHSTISKGLKNSKRQRNLNHLKETSSIWRRKKKDRKERPRNHATIHEVQANGIR